MKTAKKLFSIVIVLILLGTLQSCVISSKPNINFINKNSLDASVSITSMNLPMWLAKPIISKELRKNEDSEEMMRLISKIKRVKFMELKTEKKISFLKEYETYCHHKNYQQWIEIKKNDETIKIHALIKKNIIKSLMVFIESKQENQTLVIDIETKVTTKNISELINSFTVDKIKITI